ncbi:MAG TPA: hypothetical protein VJM08_11855 [Anaerolineales bacterium]|nr:hypothetical protein [Anaerolineales bacterium]
MFTRKRTLLFLTVTVMFSLLLAACQPSVQPPGTEEPSLISEKNITIVIAEDPPSFNPMVADTGYDALVMELVMLGMTDIDPLELLSSAAEWVEVLNEKIESLLSDPDDNVVIACAIEGGQIIWSHTIHTLIH